MAEPNPGAGGIGRDLAARARHEAFHSPDGFLAFGFGSGLMPRAPGTWGTLAAVPLLFILKLLPPFGYWAVLVAAFALGAWACGRVGQRLGVSDHGGMVWDEMVGYWLAMALVAPDWHLVLAGFVLFRVFDILKPWPIGWLDRRCPGGLGVMLDDVLAGAYAMLLLAGLSRWLPG